MDSTGIGVCHAVGPAHTHTHTHAYSAQISHNFTDEKLGMGKGGG